MEGVLRRGSSRACHTRLVVSMVIMSEDAKSDRPQVAGNRSLSGVLFQPAPARNNPSHIHQGGAGSDQGDSDQQQVAAA